MRPTFLTLLRGSRAALWAALVSLALLQAAAAGHSSQHVVEDLGESCEFCLKLDETKTSFADTGSSAPVQNGSADTPRFTGLDHTTRPVLSASIRAPPFA